MRSRFFFARLAPVAAACIALPAAGQVTKPSAPHKDPPNAIAIAYGHPSLEGVWASNFLLLMEAGPSTPKLVVPEAEAKVVAAAVANAISDELTKMLDPELPALIRSTEGLPLVRGERRTRLVVEPTDGKLPYTESARAELNTREKESFDNPEDRPSRERCLVGLGQPPMTTFTYLNRLQIVQTPNYVVLHIEYGDDVRIVPFSKTHKAALFRSQLGDSIARWEGDTLVIETVGLPDDTRRRFFPTYLVPGDSKVIERLTRISETELRYQFTVIDPKTYTAPWLAEFSWYKTEQPIYESACHEGDYSLRGILAGARREEALEKADKGAKAR